MFGGVFVGVNVGVKNGKNGRSPAHLPSPGRAILASLTEPVVSAHTGCYP